MKGISLQDIIKYLEEWAPLYYALPEDNPGLQVGRKDKKVKKILVCLTLTKSIVEYAVKQKTDLIVSHHPLIYKPLKSIVYEDFPSNLIMEMVKSDIACYAMHTNLDTAENGVSYTLAKKLSLKDIEGLISVENAKLYKLVTFVPKDYLEKVRNAMCNEGAGIIGEYFYCSFCTPGIGTFLPSDKASPFSGAIGRINEEKEERLELLVPIHRLSQVVDALLEAHPYEEVAYDIYPLHNKNKKVALGVKGKLEKPMNLKEFSEFVKNKLSISKIRVVGNQLKTINIVGIIGGSGAGEFKKVVNSVDVLISGDLKYHQALEAEELGLAIIDAGHFATELPIVEEIKNYLTKKFPLLDVETSSEREPFWYV